MVTNQDLVKYLLNQRMSTKRGSIAKTNLLYKMRGRLLFHLKMRSPFVHDLLDSFESVFGGNGIVMGVDFSIGDSVYFVRGLGEKRTYSRDERISKMVDEWFDSYANPFLVLEVFVTCRLVSLFERCKGGKDNLDG